MGTGPYLVIVESLTGRKSILVWNVVLASFSPKLNTAYMRLVGIAWRIWGTASWTNICSKICTAQLEIFFCSTFTGVFGIVKLDLYGRNIGWSTTPESHLEYGYVLFGYVFKIFPAAFGNPLFTALALGSINTRFILLDPTCPNSTHVSSLSSQTSSIPPLL